MLDNKTLSSYRYMSHNILGLTALQRHIQIYFIVCQSFNKKVA